MINSLAVLIVTKATLVLLVALGGCWIARRSRAALRHAVLLASFGVILLLPIGSIILPAIQVGIPVVKDISKSLSSGATVFEFASTVGTTDTAAHLVSSKVPIKSTLQLSDLLFTIWVTGTVLSLASVIAGLLQILGFRRSGMLWPYARFTVQRLAREREIRRQIKVLLHENLSGPMTCGVLDPVIVLPSDAQNWNNEDLNRALVHELEHVSRYDSVTRCIARIVCAMYWFHPLVWMAWRKLVLESERSCDDAVLRYTEATKYADQLVELARRASRARRSPLLAMANRADLTARIAAMLNEKQRRGRVGTVGIAIMIAAAVAFVISLSPLILMAAPQAQPRPTFEVTSIKPSFSGGVTYVRPISGRLTADASPQILIQYAYGVQPFQIEGGADWIRSNRYQIEARAAGSVSRDRMLLMMQSLLEDRFQLRIHQESRELPLYALEAARGGLKLTAPREGTCTDSDADSSWEWAGGRMAAPGELAPAEPRCGSAAIILGPRGAHLQGGKLAMLAFVKTLSMLLGRTVIDRTGFSALFDVQLDFVPDESTPTMPSPPPDSGISGTSIQQALRQLGLQLVSTRGPGEILVIDHAEKPSQN